MNQSEYKASFMLDQRFLDEFIQYLLNVGQKQEKTSKYQVAVISHDGASILVYQSGIVIFEDDEKIRDLIGEFLESNNIEMADFERYQSVEKEVDESRGWDETPKGVWLTKKQVNALIQRLQEDLTLEKGGKHERGRFVRDEQILVINNSGVVYTIGGFEGIINLLREIIEENNPYEEYDRIVILDEQGRWERLGPVCFALVDVMQADAIELQLRGIKDDSMSRNIDHVEMMPLVEEHSTYQTLVFTPEEINSEVQGREEYQEFLNQAYREFISGQLLNLNEHTLLITDSQLHDLVEHDHHLVLNRDNRDSPAIGISSTVTNATISKWQQDWYLKVGFDIERHNLDKIRDHTNADLMAKSFLL